MISKEKNVKNDTMYKSKLQEYLQKGGWPIPKYVTVRTGGQDHTPEFLSTVCVLQNDEELLFTSIASYSSVKKAEDAAAGFALEKLRGAENCTPKMNISNGIFLLDLENQGGALEVLAKSVTLDKDRAHVFLGKNSGLPGINHETVTVHRTMCSRPDAADVAMILFLGSLKPLTPTTVFVLTRDHFGDVLEELYKNQNLTYLSSNLDVHTFANVKDLVTQLENFQK